MSFLLLMVAFVFSGLLNIAGKALVEMGLGEYRGLYLLAFFSTAAVLGMAIMFSRREKALPQDRSVGMVMAVGGTGAMLFLLLALEYMPGIVVFPVRNLGNLVVIGMVSLLVWKDRLSTNQWLGIIFAIVAMWLIY